MKKLLFTFIIAYFISLPLTVTASPGSHPGEFKDTEFNIGGISFGSPMEYVIEIYGEPSSKEEHIEENSAILTYNYNNLFIHLLRIYLPFAKTLSLYVLSIPCFQPLTIAAYFARSATGICNASIAFSMDTLKFAMMF